MIDQHLHAVNNGALKREAP